jgi:hypothetical protein
MTDLPYGMAVPLFRNENPAGGRPARGIDQQAMMSARRTSPRGHGRASGAPDPVRGNVIPTLCDTIGDAQATCNAAARKVMNTRPKRTCVHSIYHAMAKFAAGRDCLD